jgi:hypothetical protein
MLIGTLIQQKENVIYFFCSRSLNEPDRQDPKNILRAFVHQLSLRSHQDGLPKLVMSEYSKKQSTGMASGGLDFQECHDLIIALLKCYHRTTIVIDAVDECYAEKKFSLLASLRTIVDSSTTLVRVFISSRDDRDIVVRLQGLPNVTIEENFTKKDMERFVEKELRRCIECKDLLYGDVSLELEDKLGAELLAKASGMWVMMVGYCVFAGTLMYIRFLWVRLQIQLLCEMQTEYHVLSSLGRLPTTLIDIYDRLYERIERSPSFYEAQKALAWLLCAREPLRPEQWASAVWWALERKPALGDTYPIRLNAETLRGMCQNLVVYDEMQDNITYAHISVREYLETKPQFSKLILETMAAESCLRFMIKTRLPRASELEYGFYKYSARHWVSHVKDCDKWVPPELDEFLGTWLEPSTAYREWKGAVELFGRRYREYGYADEIGTLTNALLLAAYYGIRYTALWKRGNFDPDATDERGLSLLALASQNGQREIVLLLVRNGAAINPVPIQIDTNTAITSYKPRHSYLSPFDVDECHPLFLSIRGGHSEIVVLLLDFGASIQGITTLEVAARYGPANVLLRILQRDPYLTVTEETVIQAVTNKSYPELLKVCLDRCPNSCVTGGVIEAVLDLRQDCKEVVTQLLANRITARVLTGIWRLRRMSRLETLMSWIPNLPVTEDVVAKLAKDSLPGDDGVVEVLRALLPGASITAATLKAVFRGQGAVDLLSALLKRKTGRVPVPESELSKNSTGSESLELLFERNVHIPISEDVVLAAMHNESQGLELTKLLFSRNHVAPITETIVKAAVRNEAYGVDILEHLFSTNRAIPVTEEVIVAAVENIEHGLNIIELFVSNNRNLPVTESVVKAAARNSSCGSKIMELLAKDPAFCVSEAIVTATVASGNESVKILKILLAQSTSIPITEHVLKAAAKNSSTGFEIFELLFSRNNNVAVTESLVSAAAQNPSQGFKLIQLLQTKTDALPISEDVVWSASGNKCSGNKIMDFLLGESAKIGVGVSALRAAAIVGNEIWFSKLLSKADRFVIQCGYGPIFLAAIENGDPGILNVCIDYGGLWTGIDEHGWSAELMATYKKNDELLSRIRDQKVRSIARPIVATAWEISDSPEFWSDGTVLQISGTCSLCGWDTLFGFI